MRLPDTEAWMIFAAVADHGGFRAAASATGLSVPTVSKAVARLEQHLGMALLHRTSRRVTLTLAGERLVEQARAIAAAAQSAEEAARQDAGIISGPIRLTAPMSLGLSCLGGPLADFAALHPAVTFDLILSDAKCDLVADAIDIALRISAAEDSSLLAQKITTVPTAIAASPSYIARRGEPRHPDALSSHAVLGYGHARRDTPVRLIGADGQSVIVSPTGPLFTNNGEVMLPMLLAGQGIAMLPRFIVAPALQDGGLVEILPGWSMPSLQLDLVTPPSRLRPYRVRLLAAFLMERMRNSPFFAR